MNDQILKILEAAEKDGISCFGIRVMTNNPTSNTPVSVVIGGSVSNSFAWVDGDSTGEELEGVSALRISYDGFDVEDIEWDLEQLAPYKANGDGIVLIGGTSSYEGNDSSETVIKDAVVLHIFQ